MQWVDPGHQVIDHEPAGADAEQAAEVEQMYREIQQNTQDSGSGRRQQMASQAAATQGYYGPQQGQRAARPTAGASRRQRPPLQAAAESELQSSGSSSNRAKARQNMEGVDTGDSRVQKSRRTSELSIERAELGHIM